jgi:hypothetical protein
MAAFEATNPEVANGLRTAYDALTDAEQVADTVAKIQARAIDLHGQGVSEAFQVALRDAQGNVSTLHLDLRNGGEAFLAAALDLSKKRPDEVVTLIPGGLKFGEDAFFLEVVTKGDPFVDISAVVATEPGHGAVTHLLQDLIVDGALERAGIRLTAGDLRRAMAPAEGAGTLPNAYAWEHIFDPLGNVINNPNILNSRLQKVFGDLDAVLIQIDEAWAARFATGK